MVRVDSCSIFVSFLSLNLLLSDFFKKQNVVSFPARISLEMSVEEKKYHGQKLNDIFTQRSSGMMGFGLVINNCAYCCSLT